MPILSGTRNTQFFGPVSLNANELLLLAPFSRIEQVPLHLGPAKNICFGSDYYVYRSEIMGFKPFEFKVLIYGFLSAHIRSTQTESGYHSMFSFTHKFTIKTHELQKQWVMSVKVNWEINGMFILDLCGSSNVHLNQYISGFPKQSYWVNLFHISLVGRYTRDLIITLKTWESQFFMICHL